MAEYDSSDVAFFTVDGYSLLGFSSKISDPGAVQKTADRMPLGGSIERKALLSMIEPVTIEQEGWFNTDAAGPHAALDAKRGTTQVVCYGPNGNVIGRLFVGASAPQSKYDPRVVQGDLMRTGARWECTEYERGVIVAHLAARAAAANTQATPVDNGAATTTGAVCYLVATDVTLDGAADLIVTVRKSTDNVNWFDLGAFTARTLIGTQRLVIAGAVPQYLAIAWAWGAGGTDPSWTGLVGVART